MSNHDVTIVVTVKKGKAKILEAEVPLETGLHFEFPKPVSVDYESLELMAIDVEPRIRPRKKKFADEEEGRSSGMTWEVFKAERARIEAERDEERMRAALAKATEAPIAHVHEAKSVTRDVFKGCVAPSEAACKPEAHDGSVRVETCSCGAARRVNVFSQWSEEGVWS